MTAMLRACAVDESVGMNVVDETDLDAPVYVDEYRAAYGVPASATETGLAAHIAARIAYYDTLVEGMIGEPDLVACFRTVIAELETILRDFA